MSAQSSVPFFPQFFAISASLFSSIALSVAFVAAIRYWLIVQWNLGVSGGKKVFTFRILLVFCSYSCCSLRLFAVLFLCCNLLLASDSAGSELGLGKIISFLRAHWWLL